MRSLGIHTLQYIDDRMEAEGTSGDTPIECAENKVSLTGNAVSYCLVEILTRLDYTLSLRKCHLQPTTCIRGLGFLADSVKQAYILPEDKKDKFIVIRESILSQKEPYLQAGYSARK